MKSEKSAVMSISAIMAFRMLGLFMFMPVFSAFAEQLPYTTPFLIGMALGIYGLTQACLQVPFGLLSDKIGRKPIIALGLILFALGSVLAAFSHTIYGVIAGRALQGAGAIGSTCLALVADLTRDEFRSKAMAMIGLSIGSAFTLGIILGPIINHLFHLNGIFWCTAGLALVGLALLWVIPTPAKIQLHAEVETEPRRLRSILSNPHLLRLDFGIALSHAMLTAMFVAIPILITNVLKFSPGQEMTTYLIVLALSFVIMVPFIIIAEKKRKMKQTFLGAVAVVTIAQVLLFTLQHSKLGIGFALLLFFTAFTLLEAMLPSLVSKISPIKQKGTAMGVYSTSQFFGIFVGGVAGGYLLGHFGLNGIFLFTAVLGVIWVLITLGMHQPPYLSTVVLESSHNLAADLRQIPGVAEAVFMPTEQLLYVKIDKKIISEPELRRRFQEGKLAG